MSGIVTESNSTDCDWKHFYNEFRVVGCSVHDRFVLVFSRLGLIGIPISRFFFSLFGFYDAAEWFYAGSQDVLMSCS